MAILKKYRRTLGAILALFLLLVLFGIKNGWFSKNEVYQAGQNGELRYENVLMEDLVRQDTDGDGVLDWEETLWGLNPTNPETNPGTPDGTAVDKLRGQGSVSGGTNSGYAGSETETLTETEKFARELFSTAASLNQSGVIDQKTIDEIGAAMAKRIETTEPRKSYTLFDIKISKENDTAAIQSYMANLYALFNKTPTPDYTAVDVLEKFLGDGQTPDVSVLAQLDPIIKNLSETIAGMVKMSVPPSLASSHLGFINGAERVMENLSDVQQFETDPLMAFVGIGQYQTNSESFLSAGNKLIGGIKARLPAN